MTRGLILFVHGLGGSASRTWGHFQELIEADETLADYDVEFFEYPTSLLRLPLSKKQPSVQTLADALGTILDVRFPDHDPVVLIAHSLGGLICRQHLINRVMAEAPLRARKLLLYAVPNDGASLAGVGRHMSFRHRQLRQLARDSDVIRDINNAWLLLRMGDKLDIWSVVAAVDQVVTEASAKALPGTNCVQVLAQCGHKNCVKPMTAEDDSYRIATTFVTKTIDIDPVGNDRRPGKAGDFKVVAFDLDGTLIRGLNFSWTRVWGFLGYDESVSRAGMLKYLTGQYTYRQWCEWAVEMYRLRGLKKSDFSTVAEELCLTHNFRPAIEKLREKGYAIGLISGGIDTLLYEMVPDADALFDRIYINRLHFDDEGIVCGVRPTGFDFDSKVDGLKQLAGEYHASLGQTVFVGEGFNDAAVTAAAGLGIAYPPHDFGTEAASDVQIGEDDLTKVVEAILTY